MALRIDPKLTPKQLLPGLRRLFEVSAAKISALETRWNPRLGTPVFTARGKYTSRGWTEWTQGFQYGSALLQFDATDERSFLVLGREKTLALMAPHLSHTGVHDHGFNNVSTYGTLRRLILEGRAPDAAAGLPCCELALKISGAVQAARWTPLPGSGGFIYSFNGPHSLFVDTLRSLRSLALGHQLGHVLMGERDEKISLLSRLLHHAAATARYNIYYGEARDAYDVRGRTAHESIFNINDGSYRCPSSQQGYSPFSTWTRGLAWAILGFAEQLEFLASLRGGAAGPEKGVRTVPSAGPAVGDETIGQLLRAAQATADFYLAHACTDGVPMWDTGAPNLHRMEDFMDRPSDPFNSWEPVDSSAAAIAAQGFWRLGRYLDTENGRLGMRYRLASLTIARTLLEEPYLSLSPKHEGLLLHSVYHRPNGWDYVAPGRKIPNGESSMWGDYHLRELGVLLMREALAQPYLTFFGPAPAANRPV